MRGRLFGPQVGGLVSTARGPPSKSSSKEVNGHLRVFGEGRGQLAGLRVGADVADQPHRDPVAGRLGVDEDPVLVAGGRVAAELLADVDVAGRASLRGSGGDSIVDRADLRGGRAGDRVLRALAELGVGAGLQAVGGRGVEAHPDRQRRPSRCWVLELSWLSPPSDVRARRRRPSAPAGESVCGGAGVDADAPGRRGSCRSLSAWSRAGSATRRRVRRSCGKLVAGACLFVVGGGAQEGRVDVPEGRRAGLAEAGAGRGDEGAVAGARRRRPGGF